MWPGITATRVDAAIIRHWLECSQKFGACLGYFEARDVGFWKGKGQLCKGLLCHVALNLECKVAKECNFFLSYFFG
jgi:hypothetical protein